MKAMLRYYDPYTDGRYVQRLSQVAETSDTGGIVCCDAHDGRLYGFVIFQCFTRNSAEAHIGMTHPTICLRHQLLERAAHYVFVQLDRGVVFGTTPANNKKALRFNRHVGWREICRLNDAYDVGVDMVLFEMRRETCPWLKREKVPQQLELFDEFGEVING